MKVYDSQGRFIGCNVKCDSSPDGECFAALCYDDGGQHEETFTPCERDSLGRCPYHYSSEE